MPIAIDFGTRFMHVVEGKVKGTKVEIKKACMAPLGVGLIQDGMIREMGGLEVAVREVIKNNGFADRSCSVSINGTHIYTRDLVVPRGKPKDMHDVVSFEIQSSVGKNKDMVVEFIILSQPVPDRSDMVNVRASALRADIVSDYYKLVNQCRLIPSALDIHANAIAKLLINREINNKTVKEGSMILVLDIGAVTSSAYILKNNEILYSRIIPIGGLDIERFVKEYNDSHSDSVNFSFDQLDLGLDNIRKIPEMADALRPMVTTINDGVQRLLQYAASRMQNERVSQIYLLGRTSTIRGLDRTFGESYDIQTETIQTISQVNMPPNMSIAPYVNAIGALIHL